MRRLKKLQYMSQVLIILTAIVSASAFAQEATVKEDISDSKDSVSPISYDHFVNDEEIAGRKNRSSESYQKYLGAKLIWVPYGIFLYNIENDLEYDSIVNKSGLGAGAFFEMNLLSWLTLGTCIDFWTARVDTNSWYRSDYSDYSAFSDYSVLSFGPFFRFKREGTLFEFYVKANWGLSIIIPNNNNYNDADFLTDLSLSLTPGLMFKMKNIGVFVEQGITTSVYMGDDAYYDGQAVYTTMTNVGVCYIFKGKNLILPNRK